MKILTKLNIFDTKMNLHTYRSDHRSMRLTPHQARAWRRKCHGGFDRILRLYWKRTLSGAYIAKQGTRIDE